MTVTIRVKAYKKTAEGEWFIEAIDGEGDELLIMAEKGFKTKKAAQNWFKAYKNSI